MAYLTPDDERQRAAAAAQAPAPLARAVLPPAATAAPAGTTARAPAAPAPGPAGSPGAGSGFTNLSAYLGANAAQGAQMAETLAAGVEAGAGEVRAGADKLRDDTSAAAWGSLPPVVKPTTMDEAYAAAGQGYTGPQGVDGGQWDALRTRTEEGARRAALLGSDAGRATLLGDTYRGAGPYGGGARRFDAAVAGRAGAGRLQSAKGAYAGLSDYLGAQQGAAAGAVDGAKAAAAERSAAMRAEGDRMMTEANGRDDFNVTGPAGSGDASGRQRRRYGAPGRRQP